VELSFAGFSDKIASFAERVLAELKSFRPDGAAFARIKDQQTRALASWRTQQPYQHCSYYAALASETLSFPIASLQSALEGLTVGSVEKFLPRTLRQSFGTALVAGNIDEKDALGLVSMVQRALPFSPIPAPQRSRRRVCVLPTASTEQRGVVLRHQEPNDDDDNSATNFYFQLPSRFPKDTVPLEVLAEALEQGFYNELRTQQQLGYIVFSGLRAREGIYTLTLTVQSNVLDASSITDRVEKYLTQALLELTTMPADSFEAFKEGIRVRKLEPDQRLTGLATRLWSEIVLSDIEPPLFDRYKKEVDVLNSLDQARFSSFVESILAPNGSRRRLLVSEITSRQQAGKGGGSVELPASAQGLLLIKDEEQFRRSLPQM
jgi:insulysin